ncbi:hypothetical protein [Thalassotalea atypica]|nr:hypothetical protein [Thalassotalea atypica]
MTFLLTALASYGIGFTQGLYLFIGAGVFFELAFWFGVLSD